MFHFRTIGQSVLPALFLITRTNPWVNLIGGTFCGHFWEPRVETVNLYLLLTALRRIFLTSRSVR